MSKAHPPELKKFMDKKLSLKLNGGRHVQGILRGFDLFMNLMIDECVEIATSGQQNNTGMVVIRGNSTIMLEALERVMNNSCLQQRNQLLPHVPSPHFTAMKTGSCIFSY
ncbi:small nuclear ribonucleoprotein G-like [Lagenorhynchus albirostris]|uniref:small nuclear ribonucleoprotein G-like n=1 Tax=Lagenorhynchus albirostris TaxID=27610 RepID=UPI0028E59AEC|nr:small nuclear ribonucleoprotein G-like [Lagenorhynchus albirostris]